jgi:hypothetical protein
MNSGQPAPPVRTLLWRIAFAALGAVAAHRAVGPSTAWMFAGGLLGFALGRWLGPLTGRALAKLDPPRKTEASDPPRSERVTEP